METAIYEEKQVTRFRSLLVLVVVGVFGFAGWQAWESAGDQWATIFSLIMLPIGAFLVWGLTELKTVVTPTELRFGSPVYRKRIPLSKLRVGQVEHIPFWAGIGIHTYFGRWVFNARFGRGLNIMVNNRRYLIGSDNPERLQNALMHVVPRREPA
jgi:hypothetical protein